MDKFFKLTERGTTVKTEIMAGITTFMTMAYILAVNPGILSETGMWYWVAAVASAAILFVTVRCRPRNDADCSILYVMSALICVSLTDAALTAV